MTPRGADIVRSLRIPVIALLIGLACFVLPATSATAQSADGLADTLTDAERALSESRFAEAVRDYEAVQAGAAEAGDSVLAARADLGLAQIALARRDVDAAASHIDAAIAAFEAADDEPWLGVARYHQGLLERARGDATAAARAFDEAAEVFDDIDEIDDDEDAPERWQAAALAARGEVLLATDPVEASDDFEDAARLFDRADAVLESADAWYQTGIAERARGRQGRAVRAFRRAVRQYRLGEDRLWTAIAQTAIGESRLDAGAYDDAAASFKQAIDLLSRLENGQPYELMARHGRARALIDLDRIDEAIDELERARPLLEQVDQPRWRAAIDVGLGRALVESDRLDEARQKFEAVLGYAKGESLSAQRAESLLSLGEIALETGAADDARTRFEEALELAEKIDEERLIAAARLGRGEAMLAAGETDAAAKALRAAMENLPESDRAHLARGNLALAAVAQQKKNYRVAHDRYDEAISLFGSLDDPLRRGKALLAEGELYLVEDETRRAERQFRRAVSAFDDADARRHGARARSLLGRVLVLRGDERDAIRNYERSAQIYDELGRSHPAGLAWLAVARIYRERENIEEAYVSARTALEKLDQPEQPDEDALVAALLVGELLVELERGEEGRAALERAIALAESKSSDRAHARAEYLLGELDLQGGKLDDAEKHFEKAVAIYARIGEDEQRADSILGVARVYIAKDDRRALESIETAKTIYEEIGAWRKVHDSRDVRDVAWEKFGRP